MSGQTMTSTGPKENYLDGEYVGAFTIEQPFGPHVRKCVCGSCHKAFLAKFAASDAAYKAERANLDPAVLAERDRQDMELINEILAKLDAAPTPKFVATPAKVEVGSRVIVRGSSLNEGRIGTVVEMPGPSKKYGGADAQRIEVLLDATADYEWETMWTDNGQWGWLELI
jgi:hypothetical protein